MTLPALPDVWATACEGTAMFAWALMMISVGSADLSSRVAKVEAAYQSGGSMTAEFTQTYRDSLRPKPRVESGRLWVGPAGQVRWTYLPPAERKEFIFDGSRAFFYEPEQAQVTVFTGFKDSPLATATEFLWGRGDLRKQFIVGDCAAPPAGVEPIATIPKGELCVALRPRQALPQVQQVLLGIDEEAQRINRSWVIDAVGNTTEFAFTQVRFGQTINPAKFAFAIPAGVSVLEPEDSPPAAAPAATPADTPKTLRHDIGQAAAPGAR